MTGKPTWVVGLVILTLAGVGVWLGLRGQSSEEPGSCGPATRHEAEAANERFFAANATDDGYRDSALTGNGVSRDDSGYVILVTVDPRKGTVAGRSACFEGVPVEYTPGGPFVFD